MKTILAMLLLIPLVVFSNTNSPSSAKRFPNEHFNDALKRVKNIQSHVKSVIARDTPVGKKAPLNSIDYSTVIEVKSYEELIHLFNIIRDTRYLYTDNMPDFKRRISWLYPDDGCFARAALSGMKLNEEELIRPSKLFVFGDLVAQTPYSVYGSVSWWYHVAPAVRLADKVYVLDPSLNSESPMLLEDWVHLMGNRADLRGTVCNPYTYDPFDSCTKATTQSDYRALADQQYYLYREWNNMSQLGFEPNFILGKNPPWILDSPQ